MRIRDLSCPVCTADVPLTGDERKGDEVFCTFCGAPCRLAKTSSDDEEWELEEDF
ncbi:MAG: lysine biosynthesis protein LysW [Myxococcota bacterium]